MSAISCGYNTQHYEKVLHFQHFHCKNENEYLKWKEGKRSFYKNEWKRLTECLYLPVSQEWISIVLEHILQFAVGMSIFQDIRRPQHNSTISQSKRLSQEIDFSSFFYRFFSQFNSRSFFLSSFSFFTNLQFKCHKKKFHILL